ncbi:MAG: hypothetical protein BWY41_01094 [Candidatus Atribacteria bacterium ADurb.Bin276]|uniref:Archease domain-containing protein n=1 Tax=Candidatus Atribacter allofermentans TaxID=1852833 RepID=A0A1V5SUC0_9BACT|nr:MAG: hypothetical protein BWY41_01094 [Candidatus Atribacteria bacterium ADurb.Bin276]
MKSYEVLSHTADIGIVAWGKSLEEVFAHSAQGLFYLIAENPCYNLTFETTVAVDGNDYEDLLVTWLNELLYLFDVEQVFLCEFEIKEIGQYFIKARVRGELFNSTKYPLKHSVKACTYYEARVEEQKPDLWRAQFYLDI